ncbi:MAG: hypothetical protein MR726_05895, partial [Ligilactobacillus salivarius]|nr:hypothetical protein [Ligilactobacillus salivarius]MCI7602474.1 hypothetical protein [Mollicutes bacterium]
MKTVITAKVRLYPNQEQVAQFKAVTKEYQRLCNLKCLTIVRQSLEIVRCFFHMTKYTQKFKLDLIQEYLDTGCSQRCLEN